MLKTSLELLNLPLAQVLCLLVLGNLTLDALGDFKCHSGGLLRHRELDEDVCRKMVGRKGSADLKRKLELVLRELIDERVYAEGCLIIAVDAVVHYEELSIWRVDSECLHRFEVPQVNALMEVAVI